MAMFKFVLVLVLSFGVQMVSAQEQADKKANKALIHKISGTEVMEGYLYELKSTSVMLSASPIRTSPTAIYHEIDIHDIQRFEFRSKHGPGKKFLIGAAAGFALGGMIGLMSGGTNAPFYSTSAGENALMSGTVFGLLGGVSYAIAGGKVSVKINGSKETYYKKHRHLKKYLLE